MENPLDGPLIFSIMNIRIFQYIECRFHLKAKIPNHLIKLSKIQFLRELKAFLQLYTNINMDMRIVIIMKNSK